ncbi:MAG: ABC transporter ATP-binding protein [Ectothiorhodospiraceae bacterium]|nr:ABC transporter ATP-binding protein [Ectothiorhodospiraceae bacterium]
MLAVEGLRSGYGSIVAVDGVSFGVGAGETLVLVGPNGAGKSTTIMTLAGLVAPLGGRITLDGVDVTGADARARVGHGIALVPEGRRVFADLTVSENLLVGAHRLPRSALASGRARVLDLFPRLGERSRQLAGSLSGGEQQMLAIGRAIMSVPRLLLVDELSLGLMPRAVDDCYAALAALQRDGLSIVLVEQSTERALGVADAVVALDSGHVTWTGTGLEARSNPGLLSAHFA